jgi:hypothetical protein
VPLSTPEFPLVPSVLVLSGEDDGFGVTLTTGVIGTPLFQINFLPDLIQVNLLPAKV